MSWSRAAARVEPLPGDGGRDRVAGPRAGWSCTAPSRHGRRRTCTGPFVRRGVSFTGDPDHLGRRRDRHDGLWSPRRRTPPRDDPAGRCLAARCRRLRRGRGRARRPSWPMPESSRPSCSWPPASSGTQAGLVAGSAGRSRGWRGGASVSRPPDESASARARARPWAHRPRPALYGPFRRRGPRRARPRVPKPLARDRGRLPVRRYGRAAAG